MKSVHIQNAQQNWFDDNVETKKWPDNDYWSHLQLYMANLWDMVFLNKMRINVDILKIYFFQVGFGIRGLTRKEIRKLQLKHEMYVNSRNLLNHDVTNSGSNTGLHMSRSFSGPVALQQLQSSIVTSETVSRNFGLLILKCTDDIK